MRELPRGAVVYLGGGSPLPSSPSFLSSLPPPLPAPHGLHSHAQPGSPHPPALGKPSCTVGPTPIPPPKQEGRGLLVNHVLFVH